MERAGNKDLMSQSEMQWSIAKINQKGALLQKTAEQSTF